MGAAARICAWGLVLFFGIVAIRGFSLEGAGAFGVTVASLASTVGIGVIAVALLRPSAPALRKTAQVLAIVWALLGVGAAVAAFAMGRQVTVATAVAGVLVFNVVPAVIWWRALAFSAAVVARPSQSLS
jgi:hypothetical protein